MEIRVKNGLQFMDHLERLSADGVAATYRSMICDTRIAWCRHGTVKSHC